MPDPELRLLALPLGAGPWAGAPLSIAEDVPEGVPSEVWMFLVACGSPAFCWFLFDLNRKAIVQPRS